MVESTSLLCLFWGEEGGFRSFLRWRMGIKYTAINRYCVTKWVRKCYFMTMIFVRTLWLIQEPTVLSSATRKVSLFWVCCGAVIYEYCCISSFISTINWERGIMGRMRNGTVCQNTNWPCELWKWCFCWARWSLEGNLQIVEFSHKINFPQWTLIHLLRFNNIEAICVKYIYLALK